MGMRFTFILALTLLQGCGESADTQSCQPGECGDVGPDAAVTADGSMTPADGSLVDMEVNQSSGRVQLSPEIFKFDYVALGDMGETTLLVTNRGTGVVDLSAFAPAFGPDYTLYWQLGSAQTPLSEQAVGILNGQNMMPEEIQLPVGESLRLTLVYGPTEMGMRGGQLVFQADRELRIPIEHSDDRPLFVPDQEVVVIEDVSLGERRLAILSVRNEGSAIATLSAIELTGDPEFSVRIEGRDPEIDMRALHNPDRDLEPGVGIDKTFEILIRFRSEIAGEFRSEIRILSDAVNGEIVVPVVGRAQSK
jgi:hypothetical protein